MPNPFPGIDPYLEGQRYWPDFHHTFITYCRDALNDRLPDHYEARIDERVNLVEVPRGEAKQIFPDVAIERSDIPVAPAPAGALALETASVTIPVAILHEETEAYIEILHRPDRTLVAVLELLSSDNKAEPGWTVYLARRNALLLQPVHLVELDFWRGGHRLPMRRPLPRGDYYALVARGDRRPDCRVYDWTVRQPLPTIAIPLLAPDPDILLDLAAVFATSYERGRYSRSIDNAAPLTVPLAPEDRAWAEERARSAPR